MTRCFRKKLLVIAGAGAALEFGMPSVDGVNELLLKSAAEYFQLADSPDNNLYGFLYEKVEEYWSTTTKIHLGKPPNFEDVLYAISVLASIYPAGIFTGVLGAFATPKCFPQVLHIGQRKPVDENVLRHLGQHLIDGLMTEFRNRCREPELELKPKIDELAQFLALINGEFDLAVVTTNYDNLIYRNLSNFATGFDPDSGLFEPARIINRASWSCLLHLHGSVHFDMDLVDGDLHGIKWQQDLSAQFHQNSFGRSTLRTTEGNEFPTSSIIAGYGKTEQMQRMPFRIYYSELDRLVESSDAVMFLGFSLIDAHVRQAFSNYRNSRNRPVIFIDYADDNTMLSGYDFDNRQTGAARAIRVFRVAGRSMECLGYKFPRNVNAVKAAREFDRCVEPGRRLSIWYGGMLEACRNADKIVRELRE